MKNKQLTVFRGFVCVILSLIIVCGAVVSFPAVTVNLAETSALNTAEGTEYYIGSNPSSYLLVIEGGNWHVKRTTDDYYITALSVLGNTWGSSNPLSFDAIDSNGSYKLSANGSFLKDNPPNSAINNSFAATSYTLYEKSSPESTESPTEAPTEAPTEVPTEAPSGSVVTLYFTNNHNWHDVCAYIYDSTENGNGALSAWPGEAMAYVGMNSDSQSIYSITIDTSLYDKVIFNGTDYGTGKQTVNISVSDAATGGSGVYCWDDANSDGSYNVAYYIFNSTGISSGSLNHKSSYYIGTEGSTRYILEPYGSNEYEWVIKDNITGKYMKVEGANSQVTSSNFSSTTQGSASVWTFCGFDTAWQSLEGAKFTTTVAGAWNPITAYVLYTNDGNFTVSTNTNYRISASLIVPVPTTHSVTVTKKSTNNNYDYSDSAAAGTITISYSDSVNTIDTTAAYGTVASIPNGSEVTFTASASEGYTFLGWFTDEGWVKVESSYTLTIQGNDINLVARYTTNPVTGTYQFTYDRRDIDISGASTTWTKTVTRALYGPEMDGYTGNGGVSGMPTYLYTSRAKLLFDASPLLTASLAVQGNEQEQDNVSTYKHMITWPDMASGALPSGVSADTTNHVVSVTAVTTPNTFTFKYVMPGATTPVVEAASIAYGDIATFNSKYSSESGCHYISGVDVSGVTYWSADAAGTVLLTTNQTFGMVIRGGYTASDLENDVVTVYAQTGAVPNTDGKAWKPYFEEATLTRSIADEEVDILHADYMANYFNVNGDAVQDLLGSNNRIKYGLIVMKANAAATQSDMESALSKMITADKTSAYIGDREHIAYRYEYDDAAHISNFNRTLYTVSSSYAALQGKTLTAMAYITVDGTNYFYSTVNTELAVAAASD